MISRLILATKIIALISIQLSCSRQNSGTDILLASSGSEGGKFEFDSKNLTKETKFLNNFAQRMVFLKSSGKLPRECSGYIFDEQHIVTANHCVPVEKTCDLINIKLFNPKSQLGKVDPKSDVFLACTKIRIYAALDLAVIHYLKPQNNVLNSFDFKSEYIKTLDYFKEGEIEKQNSRVLGFRSEGILWDGNYCKIIDNSKRKISQIRHNCDTHPRMSGGILLHHSVDENNRILPTTSRIVGIHVASDGDSNQAVLINSEVYAFIKQLIPPDNAIPEFIDAIEKNALFEPFQEDKFSLKWSLRRSEFIGFMMRIHRNFFGRIPDKQFGDCTSRFKDVDKSTPYCKEIIYARSLNLIEGYNNSTEFRPDGKVSRALLASTIYWMSKSAFAKKMPNSKILVTTPLKHYKDVGTESAVDQEITAISGVCNATVPQNSDEPDLFKPQENATIADAIVMMIRMNKCMSAQLKKYEEENAK